MSTKQNPNGKLRAILLFIFIGAVFFFVKTKTNWLDDDQSHKKSQKKHEAYYITKLAKELNGEEEVTVYGGRVDILTDEYAIEVEWASKWKAAIGQALWYAMQKDRKPKIILLIKDKRKEYKYFTMLNSALEHAKIEIKTEAYYIND